MKTVNVGLFVMLNLKLRLGVTEMLSFMFCLSQLYSKLDVKELRKLLLKINNDTNIYTKINVLIHPKIYFEKNIYNCISTFIQNSMFAFN